MKDPNAIWLNTDLRTLLRELRKLGERKGENLISVELFSDGTGRLRVRGKGVTETVFRNVGELFKMLE